MTRLKQGSAEFVCATAAAPPVGRRASAVPGVVPVVVPGVLLGAVPGSAVHHRSTKN